MDYIEDAMGEGEQPIEPGNEKLRKDYIQEDINILAPNYATQKELGIIKVAGDLEGTAEEITVKQREVEAKETGYLIVDGQKFEFRKHYANSNPDKVEVNDIILNGWEGEEEFNMTATYTGEGDPSSLSSWRINRTMYIPIFPVYPTGDFVATWDVKAGETFELPITPNSEVDVDVYEVDNFDNWVMRLTNYEDRFITSYEDRVTTLRFTGYIRGVNFKNNKFLKRVDQFGEGFHIDTANGLFEGCDLLETISNDLSTGRIEDFRRAFANTPNFIGGAASFNTQNAFDMDSMFENAIKYNEDLSGWCVPYIANKPPNFDEGATAWTESRPVWGTCP